MKTINGVRMIPSSLIACELNGMEVRMIELASNGFVLRVPQKVEKIETIQIAFFLFKESRYEEIQIHNYRILQILQMEFGYEYLIETNQDDYARLADYIVLDYGRYIRYKMTEDDTYVSSQMVSYPEEKEETFTKDWISQKEQFQAYLHNDIVELLFKSSAELAVTLADYPAYDSYLNVSFHEWLHQYLKQNHLNSMAVADNRISRLYIGNEFCHNLFPDKDQLLQILNKAKGEGLKITVATTYLREDHIPVMEQRMQKLNEWCDQAKETVEVVVNDWGMENILKPYRTWLTPVLGVLLNKRRKDPRYEYKSGFATQKTQLAQTNINSTEYQEFLWNALNIKRYEFEACGYPMQIPKGQHSLHLPYYQTNTSQYCGLYARCQGFARGRQEFPEGCERYCESYYFAYPKHLCMFGRYNSLFAMDTQILATPNLLTDYLKQGINRLVLNL